MSAPKRIWKTRTLLAPALAFIFLFLTAIAVASDGSEDVRIEIDAPALWIKGVGAVVSIKTEGLPPDAVCTLDASPPEPDRLPLAAPCNDASFKNVVLTHTGPQTLKVRAEDMEREIGVRVIHGLWTVLPPLVAIGLALAFRQVLAALWVSVWLGAFIIYDWRPLTAVARSIDHYIIGSMADPDDAAMLVFIIFIGGMIGMIAKSGGIQGIVDVIARRATSAGRGQLATFLMGIFIFFDDYANTIIVGSTMRPITDRLRISREKLSYIVDSTAAPVASIFPISTWIGYEVGLIDRALSGIGSDSSGYMVFLESISYRFYPILALALVLLVALTGRDFGPMARAERRARHRGKPFRDGAIPMAAVETRNVSPPEGAPRRWYNAVVPLAAVILITFGGLWLDGSRSLGPSGLDQVRAAAGSYGPFWGKVYVLGQVFSAAAPNIVLAWASLSGCLVTVVLVVGQRILTLGESMQAWLHGVEGMVIAIVVLLFAWSLGEVCRDLHTADYLTSSLAGILSPRLLPAITFVLACGISFATGTSYGTMAILMPLVIPIANRLGLDAGLSPADLHLLLVGVVSSVLAGAVFGDHCSPISDTTIMSSMASSADHIDHVRTQIPYALLAAVTGVALGEVPSAFGMSPLFGIITGIILMALFLYVFGNRVDDPGAGGSRKGSWFSRIKK